MISKLLIANRGEIALRIIATANRLGIKTIAVYSNEEGSPLHAEMADIAVSLGSGSLKDTYLNISKMVEIAQLYHADAIHPGYGFLSENSDFAQAVENAGIIFVGPSSTSISLMGNKVAARNLAAKVGVPTLPAATGSTSNILSLANTIGFPVLVKPAGGGGGKGMHIAHDVDHLANLLDKSAREAGSAFGNREVYIEKYIPQARHIEVQVIGDGNGGVIHLFDRECSIQRRYQKIVEEAPSPSLSVEQRELITGYALALAAHVGYRSAGTVEFLLDDTGRIYFLEMNTRIQVEHPVTEMVTSTDIVEMQLQVANGEGITLKQENVWLNGSAIEVRVYAEDSEKNFAPATGCIESFVYPKETWLRVEHALRPQEMVTGQFDPMLTKLIVKGRDRKEAISRLRFVLERSYIHGVTNNVGFLRFIAESNQFSANQISTNTADELAALFSKPHQLPEEVVLAYAIAMFFNNTQLKYPLMQPVWLAFGAFASLERMRFSWSGELFDLPVQKINTNALAVDFANGRCVAEKFSLSENTIQFEFNGDLKSFFFTRQNWGVYITYGLRTYRLDNLIYLSDGEFKPKITRLESGERVIISPLHGKILSLSVREGEIVEMGSTLLVIEAMKMENLISSPQRAKISKVLVSESEQVSDGAELIVLEKI